MELYSLLQTAEQGIKKSDVPSTSTALMLTVGHNAKKRKTFHSNWKGKATQGKSDRGSKRKVESKISPTSDPKEAVCFYCNTKGHWKRSCPKYLKDFKDEKVKKDGHSGMYMIELHNTTILDSWVLDTGCGTHICTVLQGLKESRRLKHGELNLVMGNRKITPVTRIRKYELMLKSRVRINLNNCCYSSEMTRNIISFHALFKDGYQFSFDNENGDILVYSNGTCERGEGLLDLGHTDMCGPFRSAIKDRKHYYVTFTDDFSRYGYVYLIKHKSDTFEVFKRNQNEVENQLGRKIKDNVVFVARQGVFLEREMISKEDNGSKIDLEEIQESTDEEPIINTDTQQEVVTLVKTDDISLPIRIICSRVSKPSQDPQFYYGFHIEEDKISDSTLTELNESANYKEAMVSPEAAKWKEAMKRNDIPTLQSVKDWLGRCFAMKDLGDAAYILGIKIYRDKTKHLIGLSQDTPDVSFALSMVSRHQQNPSEGHWTAVKNILRYLRNTKDGFLVYDGEKELRVTGYCDAGWQTDKDDSWYERITKKRTKNKAKTTKPDTEWKSCEGQSQIKAKDQKSQSQSQLNKSTVKTGAVIEEYYWLQSQPI
ncbi:retrotransposon protein, putative, ty1-copia subclass [Tanacetum coccineum]